MNPHKGRRVHIPVIVKNPQVYIVGGAVRDLLLGREPKDFDYVVVGASEEYMQKLGYKRVGESFPVYLHPTENKEYVLARKERKVGDKHTSFEVEVKDVTLEEDLYRRDLTINAIAVHESNIDLLSESTPVIETFALFDPYKGYEDLKNKILRHVSPAFAEDPLRVLRVAKFATRYPDFTIAPETLHMMRNMVHSGALNGLSPERIWKEMEQALSYEKPSIYFKTLDLVGALPNVFYESSWYVADDLEVGPVLKFALILKNASINTIKDLCESLKVPAFYQETAILVSKHYKLWPQVGVDEMREMIFTTLKEISAYRKPANVKLLKYVAEILSSKGSQHYNCGVALEDCYDICDKITINDVDSSLKGKAISEAIDELRKVAIERYLRNRHNGKVITA